MKRITGFILAMMIVLTGCAQPAESSYTQLEDPTGAASESSAPAQSQQESSQTSSEIPFSSQESFFAVLSESQFTGKLLPGVELLADIRAERRLAAGAGQLRTYPYLGIRRGPRADLGRILF
jgi:hypothetical protein